MQALAEAGRSDILYKMNTRTDSPSYGSQLKNGATSLTEAWDANPRQSQNHCMLGHIQMWFFGGLGGIGQERDSVGFERITVTPALLPELESASAHFDSVRGRIRSEWSVRAGVLELKVDIPAGATARIEIPARFVSLRESGSSLETAAGVTRAEVSKQSTTVYVGSGNYLFSGEARP